LERAIKDLAENRLEKRATQDIKWETYIHSTTANIFKEILLHSKMMDTLFYNQVNTATKRRFVSTKNQEDTNSFFVPNYDPDKLKNIPFVTGELLDRVCEDLARDVQNIALGRGEADADGKTGSTLEKIKDIINVKVTNLNVRTALEYKKMLEKELPQNQQRLQLSAIRSVVKSFPRRQLQDLADYMYRTSTVLEGNNQLSYYLYTIRREEIEKASGMLKGISLGLHLIASPHYDGTKESTKRKEKRWKKLQPVIKNFYETELTNLSLSTLAEEVLSQFHHDGGIPANGWKINLKRLETATGVYGTHFEPAVGDKEDSWDKVNLIFDGFCLAHEFVGVLRTNSHLVKLNPYVFLYDNVALKFETYDDLIQNSNDYVKLRSKFHGELEKKDFMLPRQALAKRPEKLSGNFPEYIKTVLSWSADAYTTTWLLTGREHTFSISKLVMRAGEGLHPSVVLFPRDEESKQVFEYHYSKNSPVTQPPYNFDSDVFTVFVDSSQLSYFEKRGHDWSDCFDETWDEEFVSASSEIIPNRHDYFAILLLLIRVYKQAIHHLNPREGERKTTMDIAFDLRNSSISSLLWDLEQEDSAADVFFKLSDIVSDIPLSEKKVRQLLETRGKGLCGSLRVWVGKCAQSLVYIKNMVCDARLLSGGIAEREMRPPVIDKKTIQNLRGTFYVGIDMRQFSASFPADVWYWDEDNTFGYLKRLDTDEYKTQIDKKTGVKYFLHRWGIWIGEGEKVKLWQSSVQVADLSQDNQAGLTGSGVKYIKHGG